MADVVGLGELLIDFTAAGRSEQQNLLFAANPGGAPANVLAMLAKLGTRTALISKVGKDTFGTYLIDVMKELGIETRGIIADPKVRTTLVFVHNDPTGERSFSFYRNPGADTMLKPEEIAEEEIRTAKMFHFGSVSMTSEPSRSALKHAIRTAEQYHLLRSFDPNVRLNLWDSETAAKVQIEYGLTHCDILKISDDELQFITGCTDFDAGIEKLRQQYNIRLILLTLGANGSRAYSGDAVIEAKGIKMQNVIETTGAGDTFYGCVLRDVLRYGLDNLDQNHLRESLHYANCAAAIITTRHGALRVMPEPEEIDSLMKRS